ncbi:MAG: stage III sporulation protein AD [Turicibacter sp.]
MNKTYASGFVIVMITFFFVIVLQLLANIIAQITNVFLQFEIEQEYLSSIIRLIGIVYYSEFVSTILEAADLGKVSKVVEYIVKLYLIGYSLPILLKLFELIFSIL